MGVRPGGLVETRLARARSVSAGGMNEKVESGVSGKSIKDRER